MAQTTDAMSMKDAKIEIKIAAGAWTDIGGSSNEVSADGFDRQRGEAYTFVGDSAIVLRGKRNGGTITCRVLYTEVVTEAFKLLWDAFVAAEDVEIRWSPKGGAAGEFQFSSSVGFVDKGTPPGGEAGSPDPMMVEFTIYAGSVTQSVIV